MAIYHNSGHVLGSMKLPLFKDSIVFILIMLLNKILFFRPFYKVDSVIANSWKELERQNWKASKNIHEWNSKSYFDYSKIYQNIAPTLRPGPLSGVQGNQANEPFQEGLNPFKALVFKSLISLTRCRKGFMK